MVGIELGQHAPKQPIVEQGRLTGCNTTNVAEADPIWRMVARLVDITEAQAFRQVAVGTGQAYR